MISTRRSSGPGARSPAAALDRSGVAGSPRRAAAPRARAAVRRRDAPDLELQRRAHALQDARDLLGRLDAPADGVAPRTGQVDEERVDQRLGSDEQRLERLPAVPPHEGVGILARPAGTRPGPRGPPRRRSRSSGTPRAARRRRRRSRRRRTRESTEDAELVGGERGAERRHDLLDAGLGEGDHVQVALDEDARARRRIASRACGEPVERVPLVEERGLRRVQVLRRRIAAARACPAARARRRRPRALSRRRWGT